MNTRPASRIKVHNVVLDMHGRKWLVLATAEASVILQPFAVRLPRIIITVAMTGIDTTYDWEVAPGDLLSVQ